MAETMCVSCPFRNCDERLQLLRYIVDAPEEYVAVP